MKESTGTELTQNENRHREAPVTERQLDCATGLRAHIITGGVGDPADSNPDAP